MRCRDFYIISTSHLDVEKVGVFMRKIVSKSCFTNLLNLWESKGVKALNKALNS